MADRGGGVAVLRCGTDAGRVGKNWPCPRFVDTGYAAFFEDDVQRSTQVESTDVVCDPSGIQFLVP